MSAPPSYSRSASPDWDSDFGDAAAIAELTSFLTQAGISGAHAASYALALESDGFSVAVLRSCAWADVARQLERSQARIKPAHMLLIQKALSGHSVSGSAGAEAKRPQRRRTRGRRSRAHTRSLFCVVEIVQVASGASSTSSSGSSSSSPQLASAGAGAAPAPLCLNCNARPRYVDAGAGVQHAFCGRTCSGKYMSAHGSAPPPTPVGAGGSGGGHGGWSAQVAPAPPAPSVAMCLHCGVRPRFSANGVTHSCCGRTCVGKYQAAHGGQSPPPPVSSGSSGAQASFGGGGHSGGNGGGSSRPLCPVCKMRACYEDARGRHATCGRTCAAKYAAAMGRPLPGPTPMGASNGGGGGGGAGAGGSGGAGGGGGGGGGMLRAMSPSDPKYAGILEQWRTTWSQDQLHGPAPPIRAVLSVWAPGPFAKYEAYKALVGNERRRMHGTKLTCAMAPDASGAYAPCASSSCSLCSILRSGFQTRFVKANTGFSRFGAGVYFANNSQKANDFTTPNSAGLRAVLMCKVACGRVYKTQTNQQHLTAPPHGADSVVGEPGVDLNYSETVVYSNDAACACYVLLY
jgi:hypothetical protein